MASKPVTQQQYEQAREAVEVCGSKAAAARELGIPRCTLTNRLLSYETRTQASGGSVEYEENRTENEVTIDVAGHDGGWIKNKEDAIAKAGLDMDVWELVKATVGKSEVTMKIRGKGGDRPLRCENQSLKFVFKRTIPRPIEEAVERFCERIKKQSPKLLVPKYKTAKHPHMVELALFDAHFGKLAWGQETGQNYDLGIAQTLYREAAIDLLCQTSHLNIDRFLFPIGQDFFHIDNEHGLTPKSGNILDTDGRIGKTIEVGLASVVEVIMLCLAIAPVDVVWVPGNHDPIMSLWLAHAIKARFHQTNEVVIDASPTKRKAYVYGKTLIAFTHGDEEPPKSLPAIIMAENRDKMAEMEHLEIHTGHFHKKKKMEFDSVDTLPGNVVHRILPSLSGRDAWHAGKGYGSMQAAEAYAYSLKGPQSTYTAWAQNSD